MKFSDWLKEYKKIDDEQKKDMEQFLRDTYDAGYDKAMDDAVKLADDYFD